MSFFLFFTLWPGEGLPNVLSILAFPLPAASADSGWKEFPSPTPLWLLGPLDPAFCAASFALGDSLCYDEVHFPLGRNPGFALYSPWHTETWAELRKVVVPCPCCAHHYQLVLHIHGIPCTAVGAHHSTGVSKRRASMNKLRK